VNVSVEQSSEMLITVQRTRSWWLGIVFSLIGIGVSAYLAWIRLTGDYASCVGIGNCESVNSSRFAEIGGVPIALIGLIGYVLILFSLIIELRAPDRIDFLRLILFGFTLTGSLYSLYLTYLEVYVLHAVCPYCVISAVAMLALFGISISRLKAAFQTTD